ncbi:MAG: RNA polymerase sigma factor [Dehalococcoidia bacterium]
MPPTMPSQGVSDLRELVEKARSGDEDAIGELYDLYFVRVFRFVYARTGNTHDAEDIAGEAFLKVVRSIHTFSFQKGGEGGFEPWLFRIVRNEVVNHIRKNPAIRQGVELDEAEDIEGRDDIDRSELRLMVQEATKHLPEAQREIVALKFAGGLESKQIAQILGKSEANVRQLQFKALKNLQKILATRFAYEPAIEAMG